MIMFRTGLVNLLQLVLKDVIKAVKLGYGRQHKHASELEQHQFYN